MLSLIERIMAAQARINIEKTFMPGALTSDPVDDITIVHIGAQEQIDTTSLEVMDDSVFSLDANYTVPASKVANIVRLEVNGVAVVTDGDCQIDIYADAASVKSVGIPQNILNLIQDYPICRQFVAAEVISLYGKCLAQNTDKTFNAEAWILVSIAQS